MIEFTRIINAIDAELKPEWQPGAFKWADENLGNAHEDAVNRFERAILACEARSDWASLQKEADYYKASMLRILRAFKAHKNIDEQSSFLGSLESSALLGVAKASGA